MNPTAAEQFPRIERLSTRLINQIAAGEVVTRPAAALKELVENSLDAGATRIEVSIEEDALGFTIRDDGCGMDEDNLRLAVERYATSKIRTFEDLERIDTRGFRGEALAAISAVSRMEILTRPAGSDAGWRLRIRGGKNMEVEPAGAPEGTQITVRDLFYNTPARLGFLKTAVAEWGRILQTFVRQALTRPDVGFTIRWKGKPYLSLPPGQSLKQRLAEVLPGEAGGDLLEVTGELGVALVHGVVTGPRTTRRDRRHQYFFINGRPISLRPLIFAMEEAYRGLIMTQRYPMAALMLEVPPEQVDVNVHPTKEEVRLRNESLVTGAAHRAVLEALREADYVPRINVHQGGGGPNHGPQKPALKLGGETVATPADSAEGDSGRQLDFVPGFGLPHGQHAPEPEAPTGSAAESPAHDAPATGQPYAEPHAREEAGLLGRLARGPEPPRALAQVGDCYILAAGGEGGFLVIDQHAAHEKILYLDFMKQAEADRIEVQPLMVPHTLELTPEEATALEEVAPALVAAGFDLEPFGGSTWVLQSLPVGFERLNAPAFVRDLIDDIGQGDLPREMRRLRERICARAACRAAVKSGDPLTHPEMQRLVDQLMQTAEALRCPHGRPTVMLLTRDHLDRQFGRLG